MVECFRYLQAQICSYNVCFKCRTEDYLFNRRVAGLLSILQIKGNVASFVKFNSAVTKFKAVVQHGLDYSHKQTGQSEKKCY